MRLLSHINPMFLSEIQQENQGRLPTHIPFT